MVYLPSEKRSNLKGNNMLPSNYVLLYMTTFQVIDVRESKQEFTRKLSTLSKMVENLPKVSVHLKSY